MMHIEECWKLLGLEPGASRADINSAFRLRSKAWHPDRWAHDPQQNQAEEEFKKLIEARQVLLNHVATQEKKTEQDQAQRQTSEGPSPTEAAPISAQQQKRSTPGPATAKTATKERAVSTGTSLWVRVWPISVICAVLIAVIISGRSPKQVKHTAMNERGPEEIYLMPTVKPTISLPTNTLPSATPRAHRPSLEPTPGILNTPIHSQRPRSNPIAEESASESVERKLNQEYQIGREDSGKSSPLRKPTPRWKRYDSRVTESPWLGLMWQSEPEGLFEYDDAVIYCDNLLLAGNSDWRMPTASELNEVLKINANISGHDAPPPFTYEYSEASRVWSSPRKSGSVLGRVYCVRNLNVE
jgi:hypothetical protein